MGRKSIKDNKNIYQTTREQVGLTREKAADAIGFISADRIEKIESEKSFPHPDEILALAKCYNKPSLCNYYCSNECPIGEKYVPEVKSTDLSVITLEMISTLNTLSKEKDRFIDIVVDGRITDDEKKDFEKIRADLKDMARSINALQLWVERTISTGSGNIPLDC